MRDIDSSLSSYVAIKIILDLFHSVHGCVAAQLVVLFFRAGTTCTTKSAGLHFSASAFIKGAPNGNTLTQYYIFHSTGLADGQTVH